MFIVILTDLVGEGTDLCHSKIWDQDRRNERDQLDDGEGCPQHIERQVKFEAVSVNPPLSFGPLFMQLVMFLNL